MTSLLHFLILTLMTSVFQRTFDISGQWEYRGPAKAEKSQEYIECPDFIGFSKDKKYTVLNDCYGPDPEKPIVEKGAWDFDNNTLILKQRHFSTNYSFFTADTTVKFKLIQISRDSIFLKYKNDNYIYIRTK